MTSSTRTYKTIRSGSAAPIAASTARTSVWRSESQTKSPLIASESTVRRTIFAIGARRVTRLTAAGLLLVVGGVRARRRRVGSGRPGNAIAADEPFAEVDRPAARRAERESGVLLPRLGFLATGRTTVHTA